MTKHTSLLALALTFILFSCKKDTDESSTNPYGNGPKTTVPASFQGNWMYGNFSMTEYWSQNPAGYMGNAFEMAIAFTFYPNGTYDQYFTSRTVTGGASTYHQSLSKGTVVIDEAAKTITTHASTAHYRQTKNGGTLEDRDLEKNEITKTTSYTYELGTEPNGKKAMYLTMNGTGNAIPFIQLY